MNDVKIQQDPNEFRTDSTYSGVRLRCKECGVTKLTVEELRKLIHTKPESRRCPTCGSIVAFI
jgi:hypothetical protein